MRICFILRLLAAALFAALPAACRATPPSAPPLPPLRFEVSVAEGLLPGPENGRLIVVLAAPDRKQSPLSLAEDVLNRDSPVLGIDAHGLAPGHPAVFDTSQTAAFPLGILNGLPAGTYHAQAIFVWNRDRRAHLMAPGNLVSKPLDVIRGEGAAPSVIQLALTEMLPAEQRPPETASVRYIEIPSPRLSRFWKRPMSLRAGVVLPPEFDSQPNAHFPLCVVAGGFNTPAWAAGSRLAPHPGLVQLLLDGDGPNGDPYQVNSDNNGPYGDAVTRELIPAIEKRFRCIGQPAARFTTGGSTGGWVSLALQVFYPDFFGGCWSGFPDPVDFRAYEKINIYTDPNAYTDTSGAERSAMRVPSTGKSIYSVRQEVGLENVLSPSNSYADGAGQWGVWNAVFGARGKDGRPVPLWTPKTGAIDQRTLDHFRRYDLRYQMETHWPTLGPKLRGKMHLWVGGSDTYYLDGGVRLLKAFLDNARNPPADTTVLFGPGQGHGWYPRPLSVMEDEMLASYRSHASTASAGTRSTANR